MFPRGPSFLMVADWVLNVVWRLVELETSLETPCECGL